MRPKTQLYIQYAALTLLAITTIELLSIDNGWYSSYAILIGLYLEMGIASLILGGILKLILKKRTTFLTNIYIVVLTALITFQVFLFTSILS